MFCLLFSSNNKAHCKERTEKTSNAPILFYKLYKLCPRLDLSKIKGYRAGAKVMERPSNQILKC